MQVFLNALIRPVVLHALLVWYDGEYGVCELMARFDASQSRMSGHLKVAEVSGWRGIVAMRKRYVLAAIWILRLKPPRSLTPS